MPLSFWEILDQPLFTETTFGVHGHQIHTDYVFSSPSHLLQMSSGPCGPIFQENGEELSNSCPI